MCVAGSLREACDQEKSLLGGRGPKVFRHSQACTRTYRSRGVGTSNIDKWRDSAAPSFIVQRVVTSLVIRFKEIYTHVELFTPAPVAKPWYTANTAAEPTWFNPVTHRLVVMYPWGQTNTRVRLVRIGISQPGLASSATAGQRKIGWLYSIAWATQRLSHFIGHHQTWAGIMAQF